MDAQPHAAWSEGTDAGLLGATVVALWYLLLDLLAGRPLRSPSVLGQLFLTDMPHPDPRHLDFAAIIGYTVVHYAAFMLAGVLTALLVRLAVRSAIARFGLVMLGVTFEVLFYVVVQSVSTEVGSLFPLWTVLGANLLATGVVGAYFWRRYPELAGILREEPLGA